MVNAEVQGGAGPLWPQVRFEEPGVPPPLFWGVSFNFCFFLGGGGEKHLQPPFLEGGSCKM